MTKLIGRVRGLTSAGVLLGMAAVPGLARPAQYRRTQPLPAGEIEIVIVGIAVLVTFGAVLGLIWNRLNAKRSNAVSRRP
jgi:hypothetical protein